MWSRRYVVALMVRLNDPCAQGISEMSVSAFANGGMNVTGLRLVDFTDPAVKSYAQSWSVVNRNVKTVAGTSNSKIIQVGAYSRFKYLLSCYTFQPLSKHGVFPCLDNARENVHCPSTMDKLQLLTAITSCKKLEFKTVSVDGLGSGMGKW